MFAIEPHESGRRIRRGYVVALGLVAGFALYGKYEARKPAAFTQHWPDRWSLVSHACTPLDVDAQVHQFEGGLDEMMCYAAAGRFAQVRELLGVPGMPSVGALVVEAHFAAHRGDPRAQAVLDELGGKEGQLHRGVAAYRAGEDATAMALLEPLRFREGYPWGSSGYQEADLALHDIAMRVPLTDRKARCWVEGIERLGWAEEWVSCHHPGVTCLIEPPLHPWLVAREACTAAMTLPIAGLDRVDPLLCDAAAGRLGRLEAAPADKVRGLIYLLQPFFTEDARARDAFDAIVKRDWDGMHAVYWARLASEMCHVAIANDLLAQIPDNLPEAKWIDVDVAKVRDKLAHCR